MLNEITITKASKEQAPEIARLIMLAMNHDCCQYFAGPEHTLDDFHCTMTRLVTADNSQYSYLNAIVALDSKQKVVGIAVSYDGAELHSLRKAFVEAAITDFNQDFSDLEDETQAGELYIDSLAVDERFRGRGIASELLRATIDNAKQMKLPAVGLLVDKGNPCAERLYRRLGFCYMNDAVWGGHPMKHLQVVF